MNEPLENAYKTPETPSTGRAPEGSRLPTVGAWLALLIFVPVSFLVALVTTCTGSYIAIDATGLFRTANMQYVDTTNFFISFGVGAFAAIAVSILITRFILRLSRNKSAQRESNQ